MVTTTLFILKGNLQYALRKEILLGIREENAVLGYSLCLHV